MLYQTVDIMLAPVAWWLEQNHKSAIGIRRTKCLAHAYNRWRHGAKHHYRVDQYRKHFAELARENGGLTRPPLVMKDGWALDETHKLPFLQEMLKDADVIVAERGGKKRESWGKPFFQDLWSNDLLDRFPSFLNFLTSSDMVATVSQYMGFIPHLSGHITPGIRLNESTMEFDEKAGSPPRASQLFHLDYHDDTMIYVIVPLVDITDQHGPWCFLPKSVSAEVIKKTDYFYRPRKCLHYISDDEVYAVADRNDLISFTYPRGTVLFIESGTCFHYGSRDAARRRYQFMFAYSSSIRHDFTYTFRRLNHYQNYIQPGDFRLRRMVLDRNAHDK